MRSSMYSSRPLAFGTTFATLLSSAAARNFSSAPSPNLDLSGLGRVALAGDFDSISLYTYQGQTQNANFANGSQYLFSQYPDGSFQSLALADAFITTMCPFVSNGALQGVVVGGNFTSLGGVPAQGIALWNPNTTKITPLDGLSGSVSAVYCDDASSTVYVGGSFTGGNSTNAIAWASGWTNLPFAGFNGPVTSIAKSSSGTIIFGGSFDGLGNTTTPTNKDVQVINLSAGNITSGASTSTDGFSDPRNIICQTGEDSAGNAWLLEDNTPGFWRGSFGFGFNPTKLRLYNTNQDGRGTKTWRFTAFPLGGIMNFTYTDENGSFASCTANCPLPQGNTSYQDFHFVNSVGMNDFRIDISAWYGAGAGLSGIELFQDDIYAFAISDFNEPRCDSVSTTGANSTVTGPWKQTPSGLSTSDYLTADLNGSVTTETAQVVFKPDIKQSGNYSITLYTPGCLQDGTCSTRGIVNITGSMTTEKGAITTTLYQTNYYDKYDQVYYGYVDAASDSFRPEVTLTPVAGQNTPLTVVAQRVRFELVTSTGGLNGLYDYDPNVATVNTDFSASKIDSAAMTLDMGAKINALAVYEDVTYVAGNFSSGDIHNIFSIGSQNATSLPGGGLNSEVRTVYQNGSTIYVGGNFTNTATTQTSGLNGIAAYSIDDKSWRALGAGVNGPVWAIVPLQLNISGSDQETVLAVSGDFTSVNAVGSNATYSADGFAAWVPSRGNWLHNLANATVSLSGGLLAQTMVADYGQLLAGSLVASQIGMSDAVALSGSGRPSISPLGISISATRESSSMRKRATTSQNVTGVATGYFYLDNGKNMTILGGHFTANSSAESTINNLLIIDNTNGQSVIGLPSTIDADSTVLALDVRDTSLFVGGSITGTANDNDIEGLLVWDLSTNALATGQPAALAGDSVSVNAVAAQPGSSNVYVGGNFENAGSMSCPSFCMYDTSSGQWMPPASGLSGTINTMVWRSHSQLIVGGDFSTSGNSTRLALYDSKKQTFTDLGASANLPGPVTAMTPANPNYDAWWVAGTAANGSSFLQKFDGTTWHPVTGFGSASSIRGLQIMSLTEKHQLSSLVPSDEVLLITGSIELPDNGNASAVLYNGTSFQPFILTTTANGGQGTLSGMFVQNPSNFLSSKSHHLALGLVVLIGLAIACALTFLLVVIGIMVERYRRRREGYVPMPQLRADQQANLNRIPPESLFGTLEKRDTAPRV
ncbi:hypothetical protein D6C91_01476 [Aureobasidium pullulans]|uniref:Cellular morphogenesis protein n=1 Tax=Aureobasidium pullulans TaxID=5580 RepID=A0A4S9TW00_AURPU|nr:hypothetical protein D6C91_01476 [Aureobasidium pullulans]